MAILVAGILFGAAGSARAIVTDWTIDHLPVLLGERITCQAAFANPIVQIQSYKWEVQGIAKNGALGNWLDLQYNAASIPMDMGHVGPLNIRHTVKYSAPMGQQPPADKIVTHPMDVRPPDADVVVAGLNTPTTLDDTGQTRVVVKFEMRTAGTAIGGQFGGYAQEYVSDQKLFNPYNNQWEPMPGTTDWLPQAGQSSTVYFRQGNLIIDKKGANCDPGSYALYALYALNFSWQKVTQKNRLVTSNWVSEEVVFEFGPHNFTLQKSGVDTWIIVE